MADDEHENIIDLEDQNENGDDVPLADEVGNEEENKSSRARSIVWQHFPRVEGQTSAKCNHCKKVLACGTRRNGTSSLLSHLQNVCRTSPLYKKKS